MENFFTRGGQLTCNFKVSVTFGQIRGLGFETFESQYLEINY